MVQGHLGNRKFGDFLPLGLRKLSHSLDDKMQSKTEGDMEEKEEAQAKEMIKKTHLQNDPRKGSEYSERQKLSIDFYHWKGKFMSGVRHYWHGTKLLWTDTKISSKLVLKLINGNELSRREKRQLTRTSSDIVKLVPFAVFVIVPFMEFLLPALLKVFPNMLPSTFKGEMQNKEKLKQNLRARMEYTRFLQETIKEMDKKIKNTKHSEINKKAEDLDEFMKKVRTGDSISDQEILCFPKLFDDELVLDSLNRPRLLSMCNIMGIKFIGSDDEARVFLASTLTQPFAVSDKLRSVEALGGAISSLPDSIVSTLGASLPSVSERRRKIEFLEMQEEEERERALAAQKAEEHMRTKIEHKQEDFCKLSRALSLLASTPSVNKVRDELLSLINKEIEIYNMVLDKKDYAGTEYEAIKAYQEARDASEYKPAELAKKVDCVLEEFKNKIEDVDAIIGSQEQLLDKDRNGKLTPEALTAAALYLKEHFNKAGVHEMIANLSKDKDGKILVEDIVKLGSRQGHAPDTQNG